MIERNKTEKQQSDIKLEDLDDFKKKRIPGPIWAQLSSGLEPVRQIGKQIIFNVKIPPYLFGAFSRKFLYKSEEGGTYTAEYMHATFDGVPEVTVKKVKPRINKK